MSLKLKRPAVVCLTFLVVTISDYYSRILLPTLRLSREYDRATGHHTAAADADATTHFDTNEKFYPFEVFERSDSFDTKAAPPLATLSRSTSDHPLEKVLIIATAPIDYEHTLALWTHLECLTSGIDKVIIAAPDVGWSKFIVNIIVEKFRLALDLKLYTPPNTTTATTNVDWKEFEIETAFYENDRYDAGLWCDGLTYALGYDGETYAGNSNYNSEHNKKAMFLVNDSVMSMRRYVGLMNKLERFAMQEQEEEDKRKKSTHGDSKEDATTNNVKIISLNGHLKASHRQDRSRPGGGGMYWIESVYRGLTPNGARTFYQHSCKHMYNMSMTTKTTTITIQKRNPCPSTMDPPDRKECIVNRYEKSLADSFAWHEVDAMYPSYIPPEWNTSRYHQNHHLDVVGYPHNQWRLGNTYFGYLVEEHDFPLKKVGRGDWNKELMNKDMCLRLLENDEGRSEWMKMLPFIGKPPKKKKKKKK